MRLQIRLTAPNSLSPEDMSYLLASLRAFSPEIAGQIVPNIQERTPVDTGALQASVTSMAYTGSVAVGGSGPVKLVDWYAENDYQEVQWGRVYVAYQEGPPLGLSTYTNGPHQMFNAVATADLGLIASWAVATVEAAVGYLGTAPEETTTYG